jgi:hypothetical protein
MPLVSLNVRPDLTDVRLAKLSLFLPDWPSQ